MRRKLLASFVQKWEPGRLHTSAGIMQIDSEVIEKQTEMEMHQTINAGNVVNFEQTACV